MRLATFALAILILTCANGCASFKSYEIKKITLPPPNGLTAKTSIGYNFAFSSANKRISEQSLRNQEIYYESQLKKSLEKSNYFSSVAWGQKDKDLTVNISLFVDNNQSLAAFLSAASLTAIPSWNTNKFILNCQVKTKDGRVTNYAFNDSSTDVYWLPLGLTLMGLSAEGDPSQTPDQIIVNMFNALVNRLLTDGLINFESDA